MRAEKINGIPVPYDKSIQELEELLLTGNMNDFAVACEALSHKTEHNSFELLEGYITHKDKYKRLCVLKVIFRHPESPKLKWFLEESLLSKDILFAENGLKIVYAHNIDLKSSIILTAVRNHFHELHYTSLYALLCLDVNDESFFALVELFEKSRSCGQKEVLCKILAEKYLPYKPRELFDLLSKDSFPKIRLMAVRIGKKYSFDVSQFAFDSDGHVRKEACGI